MKRDIHNYVNPAKSGTGSRIDYIFVADSISQYINKCEVITSPAPDHKALILEIIIKKQKKGHHTGNECYSIRRTRV